MEKNRLEAFSDGVLAIIITIMVLQLATPGGDKWKDLAPMLPTLVGYLISFFFVAIYWTNHHLMLVQVEKINVKVLCSNNILLFVMSFIPFTTGWVGHYPTSGVPVFLYFFDMFLASVAFHVMAYFVAMEEHAAYKIDVRGWCSILGYLLAAVFGGMFTIPAYILVSVLTLWWVVPAGNQSVE